MQTHALEGGAGPPVLLLHGFPPPPSLCGRKLLGALGALADRHSLRQLRSIAELPIGILVSLHHTRQSARNTVLALNI